MLSGQPLGLAATVVEPGIALRIARDDLFEVLGERPELLRQIFAAMFRRVAGPGIRLGRRSARRRRRRPSRTGSGAERAGARLHRWLFAVGA